MCWHACETAALCRQRQGWGDPGAHCPYHLDYLVSSRPMTDYLREEVAGTRGMEPEVSYMWSAPFHTNTLITFVVIRLSTLCADHIYAQWSWWHLPSQAHNFSVAQKSMYSVTRQDWLCAPLLLWQGYDIILLSDTHLLSKKAVTTPMWGRSWLSLTQVLSCCTGAKFHYSVKGWPKWHGEISFSPLSQRRL